MKIKDFRLSWKQSFSKFLKYKKALEKSAPFQRNKKAISPLMSTIILILFAIALGGVVMSWGKTIENEKHETISDCSKTSLSIIRLNNMAKACYVDNNLRLTIENNGETNINGLKFSMIGIENIYQTETSGILDIADIKNLNIDYNDIGAIQKIKIIPKTNGVFCTKNQLELENINVCEGEPS